MDDKAIEAAFEALWQEFCPGIRQTTEDKERWMVAARAAIAAYEAALWRPIEEAPKDGKEVLVWDGFSVVNAIYEDDPTLDDFLAICEEGEGEAEYREWLEDDNFGRGWTGNEPGTGDELSLNPTHFRPLPHPPEPSP